MSHISLAFCCEFCSTIACNCLLSRLHAHPLPFFIFQGSDLTMDFLEAPLYCPITCIPISPCSVDIGNSLESIVTEFELMQHKQAKVMFFAFIIKNLWA